MLLLEDVVQQTPSTPSPTKQEAPAGITDSRRFTPFLASFLLALLLAGGSWILAGALSKAPDASGTASAAATAAAGSTSAEIPVARTTDLLLRLEPSAQFAGAGTVRLREEVMTLDGEVHENLNGVISSILIDATHLRALIEALEIDGLATLEVVSEEAAPPMGVQSGDWKEWSDRLRVRRALRRAERLGGTLRLGVEATSRS